MTCRLMESETSDGKLVGGPYLVGLVLCDATSGNTALKAPKMGVIVCHVWF